MIRNEKKEWFMKLEDFRSGDFKQQHQYKSFSPSLINHQWTWDDAQINVLLEQATGALGELNAFGRIIPNVEAFIQLHIMKEATASSKIEGTKTEFDEALQQEEFIQPERRDDWREVQNYVAAMNHAIEALEHRLPLSLRLLCETHEVLMQGVRGERKTPGEFRRSQNWIGGSSLADAAFIPPHHEELTGLLGDLELFFHNEQIQVPHLIRCAICHYQFETIHPYLDGNGRIGRLLITLYLMNHNLLSKPSLYLSDFFNTHRGSYYDVLTRVRESHDLVHRVRFFLRAIVDTAQQGTKTFLKILELKDSVDGKLLQLSKKEQQAGRQLLQRLYAHPFTTIKGVEEELGLTYSASRKLILAFQNVSILQQASDEKRQHVYVFADYLNCLLRSD